MFLVVFFNVTDWTPLGKEVLMKVVIFHQIKSSPLDRVRIQISGTGAPSLESCRVSSYHGGPCVAVLGEAVNPLIIKCEFDHLVGERDFSYVHEKRKGFFYK
jgi:hypothetical protein